MKKNWKKLLEEAKQKYTAEEIEEMTNFAANTMQDYVARAFENYDTEINKAKPDGSKLKQFREQIQELSTYKGQLH